MKKYIQIRKSNNQVISISDGLNKINNNLDQIKVDITQKEFDKMKSGLYNSFYKNDKIELKENQRFKRVKEDEDLEQKIENIKSIDDIKNILKIKKQLTK